MPRPPRPGAKVQLKGMIAETKFEADGAAQTMQHLLKVRAFETPSVFAMSA